MCGRWVGRFSFTVMSWLDRKNMNSRERTGSQPTGNMILSNGLWLQPANNCWGRQYAWSSQKSIFDAILFSNHRKTRFSSDTAFSESPVNIFPMFSPPFISWLAPLTFQKAGYLAVVLVPSLGAVLSHEWQWWKKTAHFWLHPRTYLLACFAFSCLALRMAPFIGNDCITPSSSFFTSLPLWKRSHLLTRWRMGPREN